MVRLSADLILRSPQYFNAVRERELDLRGNKIAVVENLGATEDQYDSIDLSDNEIVKLEGFPYLKRLTTLLVNNNRVARISLNIGAFLPKLQTLVLTNNRLVNLVDLDPIATLVNLQSLSLLDNFVTKKSNYRLYVINKLPRLRLLDFKKVKQKANTRSCKHNMSLRMERLEAKTLFDSKGVEPEEKPESAKTFVPGEVFVQAVPSKSDEVQQTVPTPEQLLAIKAAIVSSQTLEEVGRLEKALKSGQLPADLKIPDDIDMERSSTMGEENEPASAEEAKEIVGEEPNGSISAMVDDTTAMEEE